MSNAEPSKIGLLTDLHYDGSAPAMNRLYEAVTRINQSGAEALLVMGDLVNGTGASNTKRLLREVEALCDMFRSPIRYMSGNHDLDHISKAEFYSALGRAGDPSRFHFEFGEYSFICIDGNYSPDGTEYNSGNFDWQQSYVPEEQIDWLRTRLAASLQPVIVMSHQRIDCDGTHSIVNNAAVREVISLSGKVKAVFQGHRHEDDFKQIDGTSYYTLGAHVDGAGPAVVCLDDTGVRLIRDFNAQETVAL
jgi:UDP-2,3-diacylglucosamine pyrophosphatase LpxH